MAEATQEMIALAENIATEVADRSIYKQGTDNYARVWQGARSGALARLTAQSGEGRSGAGEDALREALELAKIKLRRYMDVHGPNGLNPDTYVGGYQAEIEAVLTTIAAALNARQSGEGERDQ